jgi:ABC-type arginine/histidine transport system permease subunit
MRIARGLSGTLQLSSGELAVGAVVAVDLRIGRSSRWAVSLL